MTKGLSQSEAEKLLKKYGKNEIKKDKRVSPIKILFEQFRSPIILLLLASAIVSLFINMENGDYFEPILILVIVLGAAISGFVQDYKAEKTIDALERMASPTATVIRDGRKFLIDAKNLVPGDIIVLESGDIVPADCKIIEGELSIDESIITGESHAIDKDKDKNIYMGCPIYTGKAKAKVYATGMKTKMGKLAKTMESIDNEATTFQKKMEKFTNRLVKYTILIIIFTFIVNIPKFGIIESLLIAISLAVAAIPEDLPAVITMALSLGAKEMANKKALIRKLAITESIGSVDIICTDKTGTLTEGDMKLTKTWYYDRNKTTEDIVNKIYYYCNSAEKIVKNNRIVWRGDETDIALKKAATKPRENALKIDEIPFSSERKRMSVVYKLDNEKMVLTKGALENVLSLSKYVSIRGKKSKMNKKLIEEIIDKSNKFAEEGIRIIGLAYKKINGRYRRDKAEENLIFLGTALLEDPVRESVPSAIKECYEAGIDILIITGDNEITAQAIAKKAGIKSNGTLTGNKIDQMSDNQVLEVIKKGVKVFSRVNPYHKLRILEILKKENHVVAMTGDGVNDSLALKRADVGISMGISGTTVAKEASDIILLDDNFATIRNAIKEGRRIFNNIRKFVNYLLTCNLAEVIVIFITTLTVPFLALLPIQILWINLITDGFPALALAVDPPSKNIMKEKPKPKNEGIINKKLKELISLIGIKKAIIILATFFVTLPLGIEKARTVLFTSFILYEFIRIIVIRYSEGLVSIRDWLANKLLLASLIISLILQLIILYTPLGGHFRVVPLGIDEWMILIVGSLIALVLGIVIAEIINRKYENKVTS